MPDTKFAIIRHPPDGHGVQLPAREYLVYLALAAEFGDDKHALLRFGEHHFVSSHSCLTLGHQIQGDLDSGAGPRSQLTGRGGQSSRAHILDSNYRSGAHRLETRLEEQLLREGIAYLDRGALFKGCLIELCRGHCCTVNAIAACLRADINHGIADSLRLAI